MKTNFINLFYREGVAYEGGNIMDDKEVIITALDYILRITELSETIRMKNDAVRAQRFDEACEILYKQREIEKTIPTLEQLQSARAALLSKNNQP